jgi:hypothetical protein
MPAPAGYKLDLSQAERKRRAKRACHAGKFVNREKQREAARQTGINNGLNPTEAQRENGRELAKRNIESGFLNAIRRLPQTKAAQSKAGKAAGELAVSTGQIYHAHHVRWHVKAGKTPIKPCRYCNPELFPGEVIYQPKEN